MEQNCKKYDLLTVTVISKNNTIIRVVLVISLIVFSVVLKVVHIYTHTSDFYFVGHVTYDIFSVFLKPNFPS